MSQPAPTLPWETPLESGLPANRPSRYRRATRAKLAGAPWQGRTPQSAHASLEGARAVMAKDGAAIDQASRYLKWLIECGERGATDLESAEALRIQRSSVNARRAQLTQAGEPIRPAGFRKGPTGIKNTVWQLNRR